jgi:MerR family mercuric resistance operon transcriptional regulator
MKISEAAAASGCHLETIRYYERVGLMPRPTRTGSGYRVYTPAEVERLRFISRGRELGFSLEDIRSLLRLNDDPQLSCGDVDALARSHLVDVHQRIGALNRIAEELERVIGHCAGDERGRCSILGALRDAGNNEACAGMECHP